MVKSGSRRVRREPAAQALGALPGGAVARCARRQRRGYGRRARVEIAGCHSRPTLCAAPRGTSEHAITTRSESRPGLSRNARSATNSRIVMSLSSATWEKPGASWTIAQSANALTRIERVTSSRRLLVMRERVGEIRGGGEKQRHPSSTRRAEAGASATRAQTATSPAATLAATSAAASQPSAGLRASAACRLGRHAGSLDLQPGLKSRGAMRPTTEPLLTIGEVARQAGMRASRIRYYEAHGVLPEPERVSGMRRYSPDVRAAPRDHRPRPARRVHARLRSANSSGPTSDPRTTASARSRSTSSPRSRS